MKYKLSLLTIFFSILVSYSFSQISFLGNLGIGVTVPINFQLLNHNSIQIPSINYSSGINSEITNKNIIFCFAINYFKMSAVDKFNGYKSKFNYNSLEIPISLKKKNIKKFNYAYGINNTYNFSKSFLSSTMQLNKYQFGILFQTFYYISKRINISVDYNLNLNPFIVNKAFIYTEKNWNLILCFKFNYLLFSSKK